LLVATVLIQESSKLTFDSDIGILKRRLKKHFSDATFLGLKGDYAISAGGFMINGKLNVVI